MKTNKLKKRKQYKNLKKLEMIWVYNILEHKQWNNIKVLKEKCLIY